MYNGKPKNDSFGPFLKKLETNQSQSNAPAASSGAFPLRIVETLAERGPCSVSELLKSTRMSVIDLSASLSTMRELQLVDVTRLTDDQDEMVSLTPTGQRLVVQAR